jgi:hypothetical protein
MNSETIDVDSSDTESNSNQKKVEKISKDIDKFMSGNADPYFSSIKSFESRIIPKKNPLNVFPEKEKKLSSELGKSLNTVYVNLNYFNF